MYFNRATILEYLERYNEAVKDYQRAHIIDPTLHAETKANQLIDYVVQTAMLI